MLRFRLCSNAGMRHAPATLRLLPSRNTDIAIFGCVDVLPLCVSIDEETPCIVGRPTGHVTLALHGPKLLGQGQAREGQLSLATTCNDR